MGSHPINQDPVRVDASVRLHPAEQHAKLEAPDPDLIGPPEGLDDDNTAEPGLREAVQEATLAMLDEQALDARFNASQRKYLLGRKEEYRQATLKQRSHISTSAGNHIVKTITDAGIALTAKQTSNVMMNVRAWFAQRARRRTGVPRWNIPWNARQVFYHDQGSRCRATQRRLFFEATGVKVDGSDDEEDAEVDVDAVADEGDDDESTTTTTVATSGAKPFNFLQKAITIEFAKLSPAEVQQYNETAALWREEGPTLEQKREIAHRDAGRYFRQFARDMYRQMGVRIFAVIGYQLTDTLNITSALDFNAENGAGRSFQAYARRFFNKSEFMDLWGSYIKGSDPAAVAGNMVPLALNEYGEPVFDLAVGIEKPPGAVRGKYWQKLVRTIVCRNYALALGVRLRGNNTDKRYSPPWEAISKSPRDFIAPDYLPDKYLEKFREPSTLGVLWMEGLLNVWLDRQRDGLEPMFEFHHYQSSDGTLLPRVPCSTAFGNDPPAVPAPAPTADLTQPVRRSTRAKPAKAGGESQGDTAQDGDGEAENDEGGSKKSKKKGVRGKKKKNEPAPTAPKDAQASKAKDASADSQPTASGAATTDPVESLTAADPQDIASTHPVQKRPVDDAGVSKVSPPSASSDAEAAVISSLSPHVRDLVLRDLAMQKARSASPPGTPQTVSTDHGTPPPPTPSEISSTPRPSGSNSPRDVDTLPAPEQAPPLRKRGARQQAKSAEERALLDDAEKYGATGGKRISRKKRNPDEQF